MNIAIAYGTMHRGSTYQCVQLILKQLSRSHELTVSEFFLPRDMPHFCSSCFSCFLHGEDTCPHYGSMKPITDAFTAADLIILASPAYVLDVSGQMKALLDHLAYQWMPHRPSPAMFRKIGVAVSTGAGAGTAGANKTMKRSLTFWGVNRVFTYGSLVGAMGWEDVKPDKQEKIKKQLATLSRKIAAAYREADRLRPRPFTKILFTMMRGMMKSNDWNPKDKEHWAAQGWLAGKKPW